MNTVHLHLILTHFPIVGIFIGSLILGYGIVFKNDTIKKTALTLLIFTSLLILPVYLTGEGAEETIEHIEGVLEHNIEEHEEFAEKVIWLIFLLGISSIASLYILIKEKSFKKYIIIITFLISLLSAIALINTGNLGGKIRHSEITSNN